MVVAIFSLLASGSLPPPFLHINCHKAELGHFLAQKSAVTPCYLRIMPRHFCLLPEAIPKLTHSLAHSPGFAHSSVPTYPAFPSSSTTRLPCGALLLPGRCPHQHSHTYCAFITQIPNIDSCLYLLSTLSPGMFRVLDFIFWGSKITADGDCSHEIKRRLLLG